MQKVFKTPIVFTFLIIFLTSPIFAQHLNTLIPPNTATHTAVQNGSWFSASTWDTGIVPDDAAIVVIPDGITVTYQGGSLGTHIFAIRVDGVFRCTQTNAADTTFLSFDTFIGTMTSRTKFLADDVADGNIQIDIAPFDIEAHKAGTSGYPQTWNSAAISHFSDDAPVDEVVREVTGDRRYNSYAEAVAGNTTVVEKSRNTYNDGIGVTGRYGWDSTQLSLGIVTMGQLEILGKEKLEMSKLAADAPKGQKNLTISDTPTGWEVGDTILVTRGGNISTQSNSEDVSVIASISGNTITTVSNLKKNHEGRPLDTLHCYAGNMTRNIVFRSTVKNQIHQRGHLMAMHNDANTQIRNAVFKDMGRTDKSKVLDDFIWNNWRQTSIFKSKYSPLGQEIAESIRLPKEEITNSRGRYSIHLHKTGTTHTSKQVFVTGNVVWGNPGWGITHHDSYADISDNIVFEVIGAGIVSESGSEVGFWDNNLVVDIQKGHNLNPYDAILFHEDYLFSGQGLGMKGRGVFCRGNVIVNAVQGVGVMNMNPVVSSNHDRAHSKALATFRPGFQIDNFPLDAEGYSVEGDGVMPVEVALLFENTTIIDVNIGLKSIERDMGVNHESRSVFDGFKIWGAKTGLSITYQADYSFKNLFISGDGTGETIGAYLWKHSHNHVFENVKFADLDHAITVSKLVESGNGELKTRNNGVSPWIFVDLTNDNVTEFYEITKEDPNTSTSYTEHSDNPIHFSSSELTARPTTFTILDSSKMEIDYATEEFRFEVDGIITDDLGAYKMGIKQAEAQGTLRLDYPERIYEFASKEAFKKYCRDFGVYKNVDGELYFILKEMLPNRRTYQYTDFPIRIKINNPPSSGVFATPQTESIEDLAPKNRLISRFATVTQSSTKTGLTYEGEPIDASAWKSTDGNNNGRINCQYLQRGLLPLGSFSRTENESEPWYDLDFGKKMVIDYIDLWNTVELNGADIETNSGHFENFYVLISDTPFGTSDLATARAMANHEIYEPTHGGSPKRKASYNDLNVSGRYVRIQAVGSTKIKMAEVEIVGREALWLSPKVFLAGAYLSNGLMKDSLRTAGNLPTQEPYTALGFGGNEIDTAAQSVFSVTGNDAIVDWIFLELRDKNDSTIVVKSRAALLQADGDVVEVDGESPIAFEVPLDEYFVAVRHRNHLGAMLLNKISFDGNPVNLDFSTTSTYGTNAQTDLGSGVMGLWAGDADYSGNTDVADRTAVWTDRNGIHYKETDVNLDGRTNAADRAKTWNGKGLTEQLPQ